jgi:hypothetical protein
MENKMEKSFPICYVCREDVRYMLMGSMSEKKARAKALKMTDSEMEHLASKMADAFGDTGVYQEALKIWLEERV